MATTTSNLGLTKPNYADAADVGILNSNFDVLDREVVKRTNVHNLLDNSDFRNPVNQRGQTSYTGAVYGIDRWKGTTSTSALTVNDGYVTFGAGDTLNQHRQFINNDEVNLYGKTVTVACEDSSGNVYCASGVCPNATPSSNTFVGGNNVNGGLVRLVFDTSSNIYIQIYHPAGTISLRWVALYEGAYTVETLPAYQYRGYAAELAECLRYYYKANDQYSIVPYYFSTPERYYTVMLPAQMRIPPTVQYLNTSGEYKGGWLPTGATVSIVSTSPAHFTMSCVGGDISETDRTLLFMTYAASADL